LPEQKKKFGNFKKKEKRTKILPIGRFTTIKKDLQA
jgi:hypothetical protein